MAEWVPEFALPSPPTHAPCFYDILPGFTPGARMRSSHEDDRKQEEDSRNVNRQD